VFGDAAVYELVQFGQLLGGELADVGLRDCQAGQELLEDAAAQLFV
jgi:hypothetical protein